MERELQLVKRALKIKKDGEEGKLEGLARKWKEAGREVAWVMWDASKDMVGGNDWGSGGGSSGGAGGGGGMGNSSWADDGPKNGGFADKWGWDNGSASGSRGFQQEGSWGFEQKGRAEDDDDGEALEDPNKLLGKLYRSLSKEVTVQRKTMLPPTPRGAYFEQASTPSDDQDEAMAEGRETEEEEEAEQPVYTLGTMLRHCGIDPQTLGWNDDEGDFLD